MKNWIDHTCLGDHKYDEYELSYHFYQRFYLLELERSGNFSKLASRYITVATLAFGVLVILGKSVINSILPPNTRLEWVLALLICCASIGILLAWYMSFRALKIYTIEMPYVNFDFFVNNNLKHIYHGLSQKLEKALNYNRIVVQKQSNNLKSAYKLLCLTAMLLVMTLIFVVLYKAKTA